MAKEKFNDFRELFLHELRDVYSAESMLVDALQKDAKAATNQKLRTAIEEHHQITMKQKERLEEIARMLNVSLEGTTCEGMKGLLEEEKDMLNAETTDSIRDAGIISGAQRIEHYEIAAYGTLCAFARQLGYTDVAEMLEQTLEEEKNADALLNEIALNYVNANAVQA